ncbi:cysteine-rich CWC family protein [Acidovorax sp. NCPPB 2350]|nr:cysteine-rich CWC family protein [Acidovorax sp. NCPPB 2350]
MDLDDAPADTQRCPVCGRANRCAMAAGEPARDCWCMAADVPPAALARVPEALRDLACLCPACAAGVAGAAPDAAGDTAGGTAPI